jgi:hypothetical protein
MNTNLENLFGKAFNDLSLLTYNRPYDEICITKRKRIRK